MLLTGHSGKNKGKLECPKLDNRAPPATINFKVKSSKFEGDGGMGGPVVLIGTFELALDLV